MAESADLSQLLESLGHGDPGARQALSGLVYAELKRIARASLKRARGAISINPTTLLHEAWIKFAGAPTRDIVSRAHFYNIFAQAMRQIILDLAKRRSRTRHGGELVRTTLTEGIEKPEKPVDELIAIDAALDALVKIDPELAQLVEWHFFAGLSFPEIAEILEVSERTITRRWTIARALLAKILSGA